MLSRELADSSLQQFKNHLQQSATNLEAGYDDDVAKRVLREWAAEGARCAAWEDVTKFLYMPLSDDHLICMSASWTAVVDVLWQQHHDHEAERTSFKIFLLSRLSFSLAESTAHGNSIQDYLNAFFTAFLFEAVRHLTGNTTNDDQSIQARIVPERFQLERTLGTNVLQDHDWAYAFYAGIYRFVKPKLSMSPDVFVNRVCVSMMSRYTALQSLINQFEQGEALLNGQAGMLHVLPIGLPFSQTIQDELPRIVAYLEALFLQPLHLERLVGFYSFYAIGFYYIGRHLLAAVDETQPIVHDRSRYETLLSTWLGHCKPRNNHEADRLIHLSLTLYGMFDQTSPILEEKLISFLINTNLSPKGFEKRSLDFANFANVIFLKEKITNAHSQYRLAVALNLYQCIPSCTEKQAFYARFLSILPMHTSERPASIPFAFCDFLEKKFLQCQTDPRNIISDWFEVVRRFCGLFLISFVDAFHRDEIFLQRFLLLINKQIQELHQENKRMSADCLNLRSSLSLLSQSEQKTAALRHIVLMGVRLLYCSIQSSKRPLSDDQLPTWCFDLLQRIASLEPTSQEILLTMITSSDFFGNFFERLSSLASSSGKPSWSLNFKLSQDESLDQAFDMKDANLYEKEYFKRLSEQLNKFSSVRGYLKQMEEMFRAIASKEATALSVTYTLAIFLVVLRSERLKSFKSFRRWIDDALTTILAMKDVKMSLWLAQMLVRANLLGDLPETLRAQCVALYQDTSTEAASKKKKARKHKKKASQLPDALPDDLPDDDVAPIASPELPEESSAPAESLSERTSAVSVSPVTPPHEASLAVPIASSSVSAVVKKRPPRRRYGGIATLPEIEATPVVLRAPEVVSQEARFLSELQVILDQFLPTLSAVYQHAQSQSHACFASCVGTVRTIFQDLHKRLLEADPDTSLSSQAEVPSERTALEANWNAALATLNLALSHLVARVEGAQEALVTQKRLIVQQALVAMSGCYFKTTDNMPLDLAAFLNGLKNHLEAAHPETSWRVALKGSFFVDPARAHDFDVIFYPSRDVKDLQHAMTALSKITQWIPKTPYQYIDKDLIVSGELSVAGHEPHCLDLFFSSKALSREEELTFLSEHYMLSSCAVHYYLDGCAIVPSNAAQCIFGSEKKLELMIDRKECKQRFLLADPLSSVANSFGFTCRQMIKFSDWPLGERLQAIVKAYLDPLSRKTTEQHQACLRRATTYLFAKHRFLVRTHETIQWVLNYDLLKILFTDSNAYDTCKAYFLKHFMPPAGERLPTMEAPVFLAMFLIGISPNLACISNTEHCFPYVLHAKQIAARLQGLRQYGGDFACLADHLFYQAVMQQQIEEDVLILQHWRAPNAARPPASVLQRMSAFSLPRAHPHTTSYPIIPEPRDRTVARLPQSHSLSLK